MPVHNAGAYLRPAVEAILHQSWPHLELIVVDDCSTDDALKYVESHDDPRIRLVRNGSNLGAAGSRNVAIEQARGEYVAVQDADDVACLDRIERSVRRLDADSELCVVYGDFVSVDPSGQILGRSHAPSTHDGAALRLRESLPFGHSTVVARRSCMVEHGRYDSTYEPAEDYALFSAMLAGGCRFGSTDAIVLTYLEHDAGISKTMAVRREEARRLVSTRVRTLPTEWSGEHWADVIRREPVDADLEPRLGVVKDLLKESGRPNGPTRREALHAVLSSSGPRLLTALGTDIAASCARRARSVSKRGGRR